MKLQLPYAFDTEDTDGNKGQLSFPPYVIWKSQFDSSLDNDQIKAHLTSTMNRYGNKVRDMRIERADKMITVTCYSDYFKSRPGEKWTFTLEDASRHPIRW